MDFLRIGYRTRMRHYPDDLAGFPIRWFRADENAAFYDGETCMLSGFWVSSRDPAWAVQPTPGEPGEILDAVKTYDKGDNPLGYAGLSVCGAPQVWFGGAVRGRDAPLVMRIDGFSACCGDRALLSSGGVEVGSANFVVVQNIDIPNLLVFNGPGDLELKCGFQVCDDMEFCGQDLDCSALVSPVNGLALPTQSSPVVRLVLATGPLTINSIVPAAGSQYLRLINASGQVVTLKDGTSATAPALPFQLPSFDDLAIPTDGVVDLWAFPDASSSTPAPRWYALGVPGAPAVSGELNGPTVTLFGGLSVDLSSGFQSILNIYCTAPSQVASLAGARFSRLYIQNMDSASPGPGAPLTILHESFSGTSGHRFHCPGGVDYVLQPGAMVLALYGRLGDSYFGYYLLPSGLPIPAGAVTSALDALGGVSGSF